LAFFLLSPVRPPPRSPLFPYTTLFRSSHLRRFVLPVLHQLDGVALAQLHALHHRSHFGIRQAAREPILQQRGDQRLTLDQKHLRSEEHTSELQSRENLVCRLLLEKKKK